jgi:hypothetical protein
MAQMFADEKAVTIFSKNFLPLFSSAAICAICVYLRPAVQLQSDSGSRRG